MDAEERQFLSGTIRETTHNQAGNSLSKYLARSRWLKAPADCHQHHRNSLLESIREHHPEKAPYEVRVANSPGASSNLSILETCGMSDTWSMLILRSLTGQDRMADGASVDSLIAMRVFKILPVHESIDPETIRGGAEPRRRSRC